MSAEPKEPPANDRTNGFEDGRDYMRVKKTKLAAQNELIRESLRSRNQTLRTELFKGISINVNGRTQPTADELKRIILLNGGDYHPYYRYQTTKFMIATNLSAARIKTLRPDDRIVRPEWITDSVKAKCLLLYQDYQLFAEEPRGESGVVLAIETNSNSSPVKNPAVQAIIAPPPPPPQQQQHHQQQLPRTRKPQQFASSRQRHRQAPAQPQNPAAKTITMFDFVIKGAKPSRFSTPKVPIETRIPANICGKTGVDEILELLSEWVGCPEGIKDADAACVTKYFYDLMTEKNYHNKLYEIISTLQRRVVEHGDKSWVTLYNNLVSKLKNELNQTIEASQNLYQLISPIDLTD